MLADRPTSHASHLVGGVQRAGVMPSLELSNVPVEVLPAEVVDSLHTRTALYDCRRKSGVSITAEGNSRGSLPCPLSSMNLRKA